ncbi:MAG: hypothetical protein ABI180_18415 [Microcoleus sp.]
MICWLAILICDRFSDRDWARSVVSRAPSRARTGLVLRREVCSILWNADRVTKDCLTDASIEKLLFSLIPLLLARSAIEAFCPEVRPNKKTVLSEE